MRACTGQMGGGVAPSCAHAHLCDKVHAVPVLVRLDELDKVWMASQRHVLLDLDLLLDNRQRRQRVHAALCYRLARVWLRGRCRRAWRRSGALVHGNVWGRTCGGGPASTQRRGGCTRYGRRAHEAEWAGARGRAGGCTRQSGRAHEAEQA
eukprot:361193-Chlamydomonas_euryale.AAC.3